MNPTNEDTSRPAIGVSRRQVGLTVAVIAFLVVGYAFAAVEYDAAKFFAALTGVELVKLVFTTLLSVVTSIIAAVVYASYEDRRWKKNAERLAGELDAERERFRRLGPEGLLTALHDYLSGFENRHYQEYDVRVTLKPLPVADGPRALLCSIEYRYTKQVRGRDLSFVTQRIRTEAEKEAHREDSKVVERSYMQHEFYYVLDESTLNPAVSRVEANYDVRELTVNAAPCRLALTSPGRWQAAIPEKTDIAKPVSISYKVQFPLELDSYIYLVVEFPTRSCKITIDYSAVRDAVDLQSLDFITPKTEFIRYQADAGEIAVHHDGWSMPKSSVLFMWWKK